MSRAWDKKKSESPTGIEPMTFRTLGGQLNEKLLSKALDLADKYRHISKHERDIILHANYITHCYSAMVAHTKRNLQTTNLM